jgi:integrase
MTVGTRYHCHVVEPGPTFSERNAHTVEPARMPANGRAWLSPSDRGAPKGFRLMVTASGYRAYYLLYRPRNGGKPRAYRIGAAADLSFKEAKSRAETIRGIVAEGKDPVAEEQAARDRKRSSHVATVRDVFDYFLEVHRTKLDHKTILGYQQTRGVLPRSFLDEPAENVTPAMFRKLIKDATTAPVMQNRHLGRLKAAVRFARSESYIGRLPAIVEMKKPHSERRRKRVLSSDEIRAMWESLETIAPTMPRGGRAFLASARIALLVGTRLGETVDAEWTEFDLDGSKRQSMAVPEGQPMWYVPAEHRKGQTGRKVAHWIPLAPLAVSVLRELEPFTRDKPRVFYKAGYQARTYMLGKLLAEMRCGGFREPFSFHDLRRTCSTGLGELGCPDELNDLILGHVKRGVLAHYDHSTRIPERAEWLRRWADHVAECVGLTEETTANVAPRLHLYETREGLPELKAAKEPAKGRRYLGAFTGGEAARRVEEMARRAGKPDGGTPSKR